MDAAWVPGSVIYRVQDIVSDSGVIMVEDMIDDNSRVWKVDVVNNTFSESDANRIRRNPLTKEAHHEFMIYRGEPLGEFSVWSGYKLLLEGTTDPIDNYN